MAQLEPPGPLQSEAERKRRARPLGQESSGAAGGARLRRRVVTFHRLQGRPETCSFNCPSFLFLPPRAQAAGKARAEHLRPRWGRKHTLQRAENA